MPAGHCWICLANTTKKYCWKQLSSYIRGGQCAIASSRLCVRYRLRTGPTGRVNGDPACAETSAAYVEAYMEALCERNGAYEGLTWKPAR